MATSTCEAEDITLCAACKEAACMQCIVTDVLGHESDPTVQLSCYNAGKIAYVQKKVVNHRNKHADIAYHFVRDAIKRGIVALVHSASTEMTADIRTKLLACRLLKSSWAT